MTLVAKIESITEGKAIVKSGSKRAQIDLGIVLDAKPGDWVLYTVNQAIRIISEAEGKIIKKLISN